MLDIKSILKVISSNIIVLLSGIVITFLLPKIITPTEYGYYSLFNLYVSYAGLTLLGYVDGIYLKFGGKNYEDLDKTEFSTYFWKMVVWEIFITLLIIAFIILFENGQKETVLIFTAVGMFLESISSYFLNVDKMTSRFNIYAKENMIYKLLLFISIVISFILKKAIYSYLFFILIVSKIITLLYQIYNSRQIVFTKPNFIEKKLYKADLENIKVGSVLTISLVCTMLMTGFGKFFVEKKLGIEQLGYYSFMFSIMTLFTLVINSVSTVLYPQMRKMTIKKSAGTTERLSEIIDNLAPLILMCYFPCVILIELFFKSYINAIGCLVYLFPIIIIQTKISIIYNNYYKVVREEKKMLYNTILSIIMCVLITFALFSINKSIKAVALATFISYEVWNVINLIFFKRKKYLNLKLIGIDSLFIVIYIISIFLFKKLCYQFVLYFLITIFYILLNRKKYLQIIKILKERGNKNE